MKANHKIEHVNSIENPKFIIVYNYKGLNKIVNYNYNEKILSVGRRKPVGVWIIKYKQDESRHIR